MGSMGYILNISEIVGAGICIFLKDYLNFTESISKKRSITWDTLINLKMINLKKSYF